MRGSVQPCTHLDLESLSPLPRLPDNVPGSRYKRLMQPRVTVTISNWAMAGWAVGKERSEVGRWGGGGPLWPGANPLCPPAEEPFSAPGGSECGKTAWYLRLLSVGAQVSGSGDGWQGWGSAGSSQSTQRNLWLGSWSPRRDNLLESRGKPVWEALPALSSLWS